MLGALARKLGLVGGPPKPWVRALADRGVERRVLDTLARHDDLAGAWQGCARLDWAIAVAMRARVEPALVLAGWHAVTEEAGEWQGAHAQLDPGAMTLEAWTRGELSMLEAIEAVAAPALALVDLAPEVARALIELRSAERWKLRGATERLSDAYDAAHAEAHARLAQRFRLRVPFEALRFALEGHAQAPYR